MQESNKLTLAQPKNATRPIFSNPAVGRQHRTEIASLEPKLQKRQWVNIGIYTLDKITLFHMKGKMLDSLSVAIHSSCDVMRKSAEVDKGNFIADSIF